MGIKFDDFVNAIYDGDEEYEPAPETPEEKAERLRKQRIARIERQAREDLAREDAERERRNKAFPRVKSRRCFFYKREDPIKYNGEYYNSNGNLGDFAY